MKLRIIVLTLVLFIGSADAQSVITSLKIGDKLPDIVLNKILGRQGNVKLAILHQQDLLIINFWATWCVPCIKELPKLDSLAAKYPRNLKVLSVAYEKEAVVKTFFKIHNDIPVGHLMITTDDKLLIQYFKHTIIPHNVWIDRNGIVKNITGLEEINVANVTKFFNSGVLSTRNKADIIHFDMTKPFHLSDSVYGYRSILTNFIDGIGGGNYMQGVWGHPTERWVIRHFAFNQSRQQLFWKAIDRMNSFKDYYNIVKISTKDSTRFFWPEQCKQTFSKSSYISRQDWEEKNCFCYELTLPYAVPDTLFFNYMLNDLTKVFNVKISTKTERVSVCTLNLKQSEHLVKAINDSTYIDIDSTRLKAHNVTILQLYSYLNERIKPTIRSAPADPPYVDQTNIGHRIDIDISFATPPTSYGEIKTLIADKYGIESAIKVMDYPVTYIEDLAL